MVFVVVVLFEFPTIPNPYSEYYYSSGNRRVSQLNTLHHRLISKTKIRNPVVEH